MTAPTPDEVLDDLDDADDAECLYIDALLHDDVYIWTDPDDDDDRYIILERSSSGSWLPRGKPVSRGYVEMEIGQADVSDVEICPQTALPPGRHRRDQ